MSLRGNRCETNALLENVHMRGPRWQVASTWAPTKAGVLGPKGMRGCLRLELASDVLLLEDGGVEEEVWDTNELVDRKSCPRRYESLTVVRESVPIWGEGIRWS
jgi:hypothetical protein